MKLQHSEMLDRRAVKSWLKFKSDSTLYRAIKLNGFPKPLKLSPGRSGHAVWRREDIQSWINKRTAEAEVSV